jgi:hypothetical protein
MRGKYLESSQVGYVHALSILRKCLQRRLYGSCTTTRLSICTDIVLQEAKSGEIELDGDELLVVEAMIRAIYEADYAVVEQNEEFLENPLIFHAKARHSSNFLFRIWPQECVEVGELTYNRSTQ